MVVYTNQIYSSKYIWQKLRNFRWRDKFNSKYPYLIKFLIDKPIYNKELAYIYKKSKKCINIHFSMSCIQELIQELLRFLVVNRFN
jgi:hypothetical protein